MSAEVSGYALDAARQIHAAVGMSNARVLETAALIDLTISRAIADTRKESVADDVAVASERLEHVPKPPEPVRDCPRGSAPDDVRGEPPAWAMEAISNEGYDGWDLGWLLHDYAAQATREARAELALLRPLVEAVEAYEKTYDDYYRLDPDIGIDMMKRTYAALSEALAKYREAHPR